MNTSRITKALRQSDLPEYKVIERYPNRKARTRQQGWKIIKHDDHAVITHTGIMFQIEREAGQQFANAVNAILTEAGLQVEVIMGATFHGLKREEKLYVREIKVHGVHVYEICEA